MPGWGEILAEIMAEQADITRAAQADPNDPRGKQKPTEVIRARYLERLSQHTGRNTILYAAAWLQKGQLPADLLIVHPGDMDGFLETVRRCDPAQGLDLIVHSPGGSPEAAEQIVSYLRQKFQDIRVIVPHMAMSAATMIACAANTIVMARHSTLGPTDPQISLRTNTGEIRFIPALALKREFAKASAAADGASRAWAPILGQYPPGLLEQAERSLALTTELVTQWLSRYMFAGQPDAQVKAAEISAFFVDYEHGSHGRPLMRERLREKGLLVDDLEADQVLQDLVMSVYHSTTHTLASTQATKIIQNHCGQSYIRLH